MNEAQERKLQKSLARFKERINNGSFYEAQQTILSISNRYVFAKNFKAAIDLIYNAIIILIEHQQYDEAAALYYRILDVFNEENKPLIDFKRDDLSKISNILSAFPNNDVNILSLSKETLKFERAKSNEFDFGNVNLILGSKLLESDKAETVNQSEKFLVTSDSETALNLLVDFEFNTFLKEEDNSQFGLYAARLVISYLLANNSDFAKKAFTSLLDRYRSVENSIEFTNVGNGLLITEFSSDEAQSAEEVNNKSLINYLQLLISVVDVANEKTSKHFTLLYQNYGKVLQQYEGMTELVNKIGELYFNVSIIRKQSNMLQNMMGSLLGGK